MNYFLLGLVLIVVSFSLIHFSYHQLYPVRNQPQKGVYIPNISYHLKKRYKFWERITLISLVFFILVCFYPWRILLETYVSQSLLKFDTSQFIVHPPKAVLRIPASLMAMVTAIYLTLFLLKSIMKNQYEEFVMYLNDRFCCDNLKILRYGAYLATTLSLIYIFLVQNTYLSFNHDSVELSKFFQIGSEKYSYEQISTVEAREIEHSSLVTVAKNVIYKITFADGNSWSNDRGFIEPYYPDDVKVIELIKKRCDCPVQYSNRNITGEFKKFSSDI